MTTTTSARRTIRVHLWAWERLRAGWGAVRGWLVPDRTAPLRRALEAEVRGIAQETEATGLDRDSLRNKLGLDDTEVEVLNYPILFAQARRLRLEVLAGLAETGADGTGSQVGGTPDLLAFLAIRDVQEGQASAASKSAIERITQTATTTSSRASQILDEVGQFWRSDAATALERIQVQDLARLLLAGLLVVYYGFLLLSRGAEGLESLHATSPGLLALLVAPLGGIQRFLAEPPFLSGFFGLVGAVLSMWLDESFSPRFSHWQLARRSERAARCFGGFLIGLLVLLFLPLLSHAAIGSSHGPGLEGAWSGVEGEPLLAPPSSRLLLIALIMGFSQDAFFRRIRSVRM